MNDLVIKNAVIVDGLGNPGIEGDLAVKDGRIVAVGANVGEGRDTVDAEGLTWHQG
jgi:N-acyl-D-amino-acid deacylase